VSVAIIYGPREHEIENVTNVAQRKHPVKAQFRPSNAGSWTVIELFECPVVPDRRPDLGFADVVL
jgi:hypothetical protein